MPPLQPASSITPVTPANIQQANQAGVQRKQLALESQKIQTQKQIAEQQMAQKAADTQAGLLISSEKLATQRAMAELQAENYARLNQTNMDIAQMRDARSREAMENANSKWQADYDLRERQYNKMLEAQKNYRRQQWQLAIASLPDPASAAALEQEQAGQVEEQLRLQEAELIAKGKEDEIMAFRPKIRQGIKDTLDQIDSQVDRGMSAMAAGLGVVDPSQMFPEEVAATYGSNLDVVTPDFLDTTLDAVQGGLDFITGSLFSGGEGLISTPEARSYYFMQEPDNRRRVGEKYLNDAIVAGFQAMGVARPEQAAESVRSAIDTLRSDSADPEAINESLNRALVGAGVNPMAFGELLGRLEKEIGDPQDLIERGSLITMGDAQEIPADQIYDYYGAIARENALGPLRRLRAASSDMAPYRTWLATVEGSEEQPFGIDELEILMDNPEFVDEFGDDPNIAAMLPMLEALEGDRRSIIEGRGALERRRIRSEADAGALGRAEDLLRQQRRLDVIGRFLEDDLPGGM